jgi:hypothetical protein
MKLVSQSCLSTISGGQAKQLIVTQQISLEGISNPCVQVIKDAALLSYHLTNPSQRERFEETLINKLSTVCSLQDESSLYLEQVPFLTVEYK